MSIALNTPLFHMDNGKLDDGVLIKHIDRLGAWRTSQKNFVGKSGAKLVTLVSFTAASVLSLAESIVSLALSALALTARLVCKDNKWASQLGVRSLAAAKTSGILVSAGLYQLITDDC